MINCIVFRLHGSCSVYNSDNNDYNYNDDDDDNANKYDIIKSNIPTSLSSVTVSPTVTNAGRIEKPEKISGTFRAHNPSHPSLASIINTQHKI